MIDLSILECQTSMSSLQCLQQGFMLIGHDEKETSQLPEHQAEEGSRTATAQNILQDDPQAC